MADVGAESMVGGTTFHREMIQREISRALVLNLSGKASGAPALHGMTLSLTAPSLLSRRTPSHFSQCSKTKPRYTFPVKWSTRLGTFCPGVKANLPMNFTV